MQTRTSQLTDPSYGRHPARTTSATQLRQSGVAQVLDTRDSQSIQRQVQNIASQSSAVSQLKRLQAKMAAKAEVTQRVEEELVQGKFGAVQRVVEDETLQGKFVSVQRVEDEDALQAKFDTVQRVEEEEPSTVQAKSLTTQRVEDEEPAQAKLGTAQLAEKNKPNNTGLPNQLKAGIESLSGMSMDHVKVHYNSPQPAQLNAHAYAQGSDIHVAPGQEQHVPHEAWHVVQQAQGRVQPTMQMKAGVPVNDDAGLEHEADVMGAKAASLTSASDAPTTSLKAIHQHSQIKQLAPSRVHLVNNATHYQAEYSDMISNFTGGASAGGVAMPTPASYNAQYARQNSNGQQMRSLNVNVQGATREYHHGHMLAEALGGGGGADNIFLQDGGQNTTGAWPSWERTVASDMANAPSNHSASIGIELVK